MAPGGKQKSALDQNRPMGAFKRVHVEKNFSEGKPALPPSPAEDVTPSTFRGDGSSQDSQIQDFEEGHADVN